MHGFESRKILMLPPRNILPCPDRVRKSFDEYELKSLMDSILQNGIISPLVVRRAKRGSYILISGERRLAAARMAGVRRVPCVVRSVSDSAAAVMSLEDNLGRRNLHFLDEAEAIERLMMDFGLSRAQTACRLALPEQVLSEKLACLRLSDSIKRRIRNNGLTEGHANALLVLAPKEREAALDRIISEHLNESSAEELVTQILCKSAAVDKTSKESTPPVRKCAIGDIKLFANSLSRLISTMQSAGVDAHSKRYETNDYIEYKVRFPKSVCADEKYTQLKIC